MKNILYTILVLLGLSLSACSDWLDVKPKSEVSRDDMFASAGGFQDALTGVYLKLKGSSVYGESLTMTTIEDLAQHWETSFNSTERALIKYDYEHSGVVGKISNIYGGMYNVIANVNSILENIDANQAVFEDGMYELIKGEALAIRAYCHFDLLRLFGPIPNGDISTLNVPYVTNLSKAPHALISYELFTEKILNDLNEAESFLMEVDPVLHYSIDDLNQLEEGEYQPYDNYSAFRKFRVNYYTVLGLKARFYLWKQNKTDAYKYAKMVIDATNTDGSSKFTLGQGSDLSQGDLTLSTEHLWALHVFDLEDTSVDLFKSGKLNQKTSKIDEVFENETTDVRFEHLWEKMKVGWQQKYVTLKYDQEDNTSFLKKQSIPMMRLYEMYLIAMESGSLVESNTIFQELAISRNFNPTQIDSEIQRNDILLKEYRKEFYAEGQMFYTYKRQGLESIPWSTVAMSADTYVVPVPSTEIVSN